MIGLTPRQRELMIYIQTREVPPTFDEMRKAVGVRHKSSIFHLLSALEERGYIRRHKARIRAIKVLRRIEPKYRFLTLSEAKAKAQGRAA